MQTAGQWKHLGSMEVLKQRWSPILRVKPKARGARTPVEAVGRRLASSIDVNIRSPWVRTACRRPGRSAQSNGYESHLLICIVELRSPTDRMCEHISSGANVLGVHRNRGRVDWPIHSMAPCFRVHALDPWVNCPCPIDKDGYEGREV